MNMLNKEKFLKNVKKWDLISKNDKIVIAVSGGVDSLTLLYLLYLLREDLDLDLLCATLDHGIRDNSQKDVEHVVNFSKKLGIKCVTGKVDAVKYSVKNKLSIEESARILRYQFLDKVLKDTGFNKLAVAHNLNDLVENVLFRLTRGAGPFGLPGMKPKNGNIIRPLLFYTKDEIMNFAFKHNIEYVEDETNFDTVYTRNFIRREIIPLFKKLNPNFENSVMRLVENIWELDDFVDRKLNISVFNLRGRIYFEVPEDIYLLIEFVRRLTIKLKGKAPDKEKLDRIKKTIKNKTTFKVSFWNNFGIEISYGKALLGEFLPNDNFEILISQNETIDLDPFVVKIGKDGIIINKEKIKGDLVLRNWRNGDRIQKDKKLKELFVNKKIPSFIRRIIPILCDREEIIYIPKIYLNKAYICKENEKNKDFVGISVQLKGGFLF
ncbi:MAG: tRNA(Ile)-lysidine synthase [Thermosipho sp. (in: thermotogales)]|nr:tRNA(Ile)-lysidine synthase [Thermosipho sp. (in: thermotogales)]MDN5324342.1 tRNA(Ile)-lysidine synthase [Thermosipho sp. (in: thermotogales)]